jgi:SpoVK/Ycf46/Vps4 family AAA+-type ATPase
MPRLTSVKVTVGSRRLQSLPDGVELTAVSQTENLIHPPALAKELDACESLLRSGAPRALLFGRPGLGKTATLRNWSVAVSRPFWFVRFERLLTAFLGGTGSNLAALFKAASENRAVLVFDDFDAIARGREDTREGGEGRRIVTSLIALLDEFTNEVPVVAATNLPTQIDAAVRRRFRLIAFERLSPENATRLLRNLTGSSNIPEDLATSACSLSPAEIVDLMPTAPSITDLAAAIHARQRALMAMQDDR